MSLQTMSGSSDEEQRYLTVPLQQLHAGVAPLQTSTEMEVE